MPQLRFPTRNATVPLHPACPADLLRDADAARDRREPIAAAVAYGRYLQHMPDDGPIWVQHGHMLKAEGLLAAAAESYDRAMALMPSDPDSRVQRAILHKLVGEFTDAVRLFRHARALGFPDTGFLDEEIGFLARTDHRKTFDAVVYGGAAPPFRIYLSSAAGAPRAETSAALDGVLGAHNYSYGFSLKGFLLGLEQLDLAYDVVASPEYIPDIRRRSFSGVNLHFAFCPPDVLRLLKGAYNVVVMAWEFERLRRPHEFPSHHAFDDPVQMLRRADEVWLVSHYGAAAVRRSGVESVRTVPSPILQGVLDQPRQAPPSPERLVRAATQLDGTQWIPLAIVPGLQATASQDAQHRRTTLRTLIVEQMDDQAPVFFLSVLNVYDYRKQVKPVLDAFVRLAKVRPNAFLLLKVSFVHRGIGDLNEFMLRHQVNDASEMAPPLVSDRIWMTADVLSRDQMNSLYDLAAFYVSTPHGEGQNLPLLEAMGRGAVPVSVDHTAMADYICADNSIVVPSTRAPFNLRLRERYGMGDVDTYYVSAPDAYRALDQAAGLERAGYAARSAHALAQVRATYGLAPFRAAMEAVIERATAHAAHARAAS